MHALKLLPLLALLSCTRLDRHCVSEEIPVEIRGTSLLGLMPPGTSAKLLMGAYACNEPRRGDIVAHRFGGNRDPIAKIIAAVPGDAFALTDCPRIEDVLRRRCLLLRNEIARTSDGTSYIVQPKEEALLSEYVRSSNGIIPPATYLLLSNRSSGTIDSRTFGLVARADLLGPLQR